ASMSAATMRPRGPEPFSAAMSMFFCFAIRRASGEAKTRFCIASGFDRGASAGVMGFGWMTTAGFDGWGDAVFDCCAAGFGIVVPMASWIELIAAEMSTGPLDADAGSPSPMRVAIG